MRPRRTSPLSTQLWYTCFTVQYNMQHTAKSRNAPPCALNSATHPRIHHSLIYTPCRPLPPNCAIAHSHNSTRDASHGRMAASALPACCADCPPRAFTVPAGSLADCLPSSGPAGYARAKAPARSIGRPAGAPSMLPHHGPAPYQPMAMHGAQQLALAQRLPHASNSSPAAHQTVAAPALQSAPTRTDSMLRTSSSASTTFLQQAKC